MGMERVSMKGFKKWVCPVFVLTIGCLLAPVPSFALEKNDCPVAGCDATAGKKDEAVEKDRRLAQQGDARAQMVLGLRYLMGNGVPADETMAQEWLLKSAQQNNVVAQVSLASMLAFESDKQDLPAAAMWFAKAAEAGNVQAMSELVRLYETGSGVTRDMAKADEWQKRSKARSEAVKLERVWKIARADEARWMAKTSQAKAVADGKGTAGRGTIDVAALKRAAENGDEGAQLVLGALLANGDGVQRDEKAALDWFEKAADAQNARAQAVLGELYAMGWGGLKKDPAQAAKWMEKAALGNLVVAKARWGSMLSKGKGVKQDAQKGLDWYVQAAQEGDGRARLLMGVMLVHQDRDAAAQWFYGAADVGDEEVLCALGTFYGWGNGPVYGESEKLSEVRRYAQRDESDAQQMMGFLYGEGWGATRDPVKAEYWFNKAAQRGDAEVWLPLGLLYAETGREELAAAAFDKAVASGGFSLASDGELLQMIFVDSEKMPESGKALNRSGSAKKTSSDVDAAGVTDKAGNRDAKRAEPDERQVRVAKKRAFLEREVKKGNPAAQLMMATIVQEGWGVKKDPALAASLREAGIKGMCAALKEKADEESRCSKEVDDGPESAGAPVDGHTTGQDDSTVFRVRQGVK